MSWVPPTACFTDMLCNRVTSQLYHNMAIGYSLQYVKEMIVSGPPGIETCQAVDISTGGIDDVGQATLRVTVYVNKFMGPIFPHK
jgi:hypothetical protein